MSNDAAIEAEIQAKGKTAPRITPDHVEAQIADTAFIRATPVLTICVLTLRNGFTVTGESACASPENYDQAIGEKIARGNAVQKIWGLEGYLLRSKLAEHVSETRTLDAADLPPVRGLDFGMALRALKAGLRIARTGWNGKGMWLALSGPLQGREIAFENFWSKPCSEHARLNGGSAVVLPCINMKTAGGEILMGWLASQTDMLAEDWEVVA